MATRRPKVPRITTAAPTAEGTDGGDVIQANFGSTASGTKPGSASPGVQSDERQKPAAKATSDRSVTASAAADKSGTPKSGTDKFSAIQAKGDARSRGGSSRYSLKGPQPHRPAEQDADDSVDPVPARAFSGRFLALAVVMIAITVMLAPTVKIWFEKSAEISALEADIAARKAEQNSLKQQVSRWQDPNYVKQQARDRINMVMPGETGYWVFGSDEPAGTSSGQAGAGSAEEPANLPWVDALWESIRRSATD
ncbi:septum formation initiator family protein [Arthrobacter sp.]|uniref:FtsB family cell division protein n=1 Tax=Arthrobacter sp. TaxID=1667 RepID=UPI00281154B6|nr:septum formation initiator family protein [Arthrobacter sp.]